MPSCQLDELKVSFIVLEMCYNDASDRLQIRVRYLFLAEEVLRKYSQRALIYEVIPLTLDWSFPEKKDSRKHFTFVTVIVKLG